jgi:dTDP-4-dehydrorhamnose reductase
MDILVLGHKGMLGHMVCKYLNDQGFNIKTIDYKFPSDEFKYYVKTFSGDFIINCIGAIPQKTSTFNINTELPIWLSDNASSKVIHPGTDCEIDDDEYGNSKRIARDYIIKNSNNTKIVKASIIGPELESKSSLLEWFLNSENEVKGYTKAMWNGITTLEWAKQCLNLIKNWSAYDKETIIQGECLSKFELLNKIKLVFNKEINILPIEKGINKCLVGKIQAPKINIQLHELKEYYYDN